MHSIYCYSANINQIQSSDDESTEHRLSPPIILVGTHRNSFPSTNKNLIVRFNFKSKRKNKSKV